MTLSATIIVEAGPLTGQQFTVQSGQELRFGRQRNLNDIAISDGYISRRHFTIIATECEFMLADCGSSHGTTLNGHRVVDPVPLKDGDRIRAGSTDFVFQCPDLADATGATSFDHLPDRGHTTEPDARAAESALPPEWDSWDHPPEQAAPVPPAAEPEASQPEVDKLEFNEPEVDKPAPVPPEANDPVRTDSLEDDPWPAASEPNDPAPIGTNPESSEVSPPEPSGSEPMAAESQDSDTDEPDPWATGIDEAKSSEPEDVESAPIEREAPPASPNASDDGGSFPPDADAWSEAPAQEVEPSPTPEAPPAADDIAEEPTPEPVRAPLHQEAEEPEADREAAIVPADSGEESPQIASNTVAEWEPAPDHDPTPSMQAESEPEPRDEPPPPPPSEVAEEPATAAPEKNDLLDLWDQVDESPEQEAEDNGPMASDPASQSRQQEDDSNWWDV
ncbi:FHA domain protein [Planctomycetes bacterium Pan216]|uniref:FHA domain protein n=1 Tax=Kolteria novifilia TaxID=2527975 RepID=A0A518AXF9_9BACT|nr:FHA domain protein [Planctomycetes bacterium Pan216]